MRRSATQAAAWQTGGIQCVWCPGRPALPRRLQSCAFSRAHPLGGGCRSSPAGRALAELGPFVRRGRPADDNPPRPHSAPSGSGSSTSSPATAAWLAASCTCSPCGTTSGLSFASGASTPWNLIRCNLGCGTGARNAPFCRPGGPPLHELQRAHHQMRGPVAPRCLQLQLHLSCGVELHPFFRQRGAGDVAAQLLQPLAVVRVGPHSSVKAEAVDVRAQRLARRSLARHCASQGVHLLPDTELEGDAVG
jgi:hypothetical protein